MSNLLVKPSSPDNSGRVVHVTPSSANWKYVGFDVHKLSSETTVDIEASDRECCIVVLWGKVNVQVGDESFTDIGERDSIFEDTPAACVYVPAQNGFTITSTDDAEVALCSAPGNPGRKVKVVEPSDVYRETRGNGTNVRHVNSLLAGEDNADSLIIFEVYTPAGHWSSYPPHKHDQDMLPTESALEETYYHRLNPPQGFAFQRVYTDDRELDETMTVEDGDTVLVPRGYHPVGAPHGYDLYYLNVMAGPKRSWIFKNDPDHEWIVEQ